MSSEFPHEIEKDLKKNAGFVETIRSEMKEMRASLDVTLTEISEITGISEEKIFAQEEGHVAADLEIITPVMLIFYMLAMDSPPQWLIERLENIRK